MSAFPQRIDTLNYITQAQPGDVGAPAALIGLVNDAILSAEKHLGFSVRTGGDIRVDGTSIPPGPGRRLLTLSGTWEVNPVQQGLYGLFAPLSLILDTTHLSSSYALGITGLQVPDLLAAMTSPFFLHVQRRRNGLKLQSAVIVTLSGEALLAVSLPHGLVDAGTEDFGGALIAGETLDVFALLWGGT